MGLKKLEKFLFAGLVFTGKRLDSVDFQSILQATSNQSPEVCLTANL